MTRWRAEDVPDQTGRTVVVTGANSGLGAAAAGVLAGKGAAVVLACRNVDNAKAAAARMTGDVTVRRLDLADLASIRAFAERTPTVDVLVNNAGVMAVPHRTTADGFELQLGTNFLGHFALTALLMPRITDRVVTMSSQAHRIGRIALDDLNWTRRRYRRWQAYAQSKLADLVFAVELQRRLTACGHPQLSLAAHPGYAATALQSHTESIADRVMAVANRLVAQSDADGALPELYAATMPDLEPGGYYGPDGFGELRGSPRLVQPSSTARDQALAAQLWRAAETSTGVCFEL